MNRLEQLTAKPETCEKLVTLGIVPEAIIWHLFEEDEVKIKEAEDAGKDISDEDFGKWDACLLNEPVYVPEYKVPAWTKAEIDAMIGPNIPKPDLFTPDQLGNSKTLIAETYPVIFPDKMLVYDNGAEASAQALIWLIKNKYVTIADANYRYSKTFKK